MIVLSRRGYRKPALWCNSNRTEKPDQLIRIATHYANAFCNRGLARRDRGDNEGAVQDFAEAIRLNPNFSNAFYNRGVARRAKGDNDGADDDFKRVQSVKIAGRT
jgi:tetratricopeptide (TPR) repeat protein